MTPASGLKTPPRLVECGVSGRALESETVSGDAHVVAPFERGVLIAVIDGLGHGPEAAAAANIAVDTLERHAGKPVTDLAQLCHSALRKTRGAVMSMASFDRDSATMTWLGIGNVDGILIRHSGGAKESLLLRGGVVGYQLPPLRPITLPVFAGDLLIFATDGIRSDFHPERLLAYTSPQEIADSVLASHARVSDDAMVLVARYRGDGP